MSIESKRTTVRNIFVKYTSFSKREAERIVREAENEIIEVIAAASPEEAKAAVQKVFNDIRIAEGQSIKDQQIKEPSPVLDESDPVVVVETAAEEEGTSPAAGLDADE